MVFGSVISSARGNLSLQQQLDLASAYLDTACKATDSDIVLVLCHDTETVLTQVKKAAKTKQHQQDMNMRERIAMVFVNLGDLLEKQGHQEEAQAFFKKSERWSGRVYTPGSTINSLKAANLSNAVAQGAPSFDSPSRPSLKPTKQSVVLIATIPPTIFQKNVRPPTINFKPPEPDSRLNDTPQLACCLELLKGSYEPEDILDQPARDWLETTRKEFDEIDRLKALATDVVRAFKRDELKDGKAVAEVVYLAPVLQIDDFRYLVKEFYSGIDHSGLLDVHQLEGLAQLIQDADPGHLEADDLVKILELLSSRLKNTHQQSPKHQYQLTLAVSHVLDAMADADVKGLDRERLHEPLKSYLDGLKGSSDAYLVYQAAYAYQALLCVPDDDTLWKATLRRTGKVIKGVAGLVSAVKGLDLVEFVDGLKDIQQGLAGASDIIQIAKDAYEGAMSLAQGGQRLFTSLKEGLSFDRKCAWYPALRGAEALILEGHLEEFKRLVCQVPCRYDPAFQWGVCQLLEGIVADAKWDPDTRQEAIAFLGEIYRNDTEWGDQSTSKQMVLNILIHLSSGSGRVMRFSKTLLQELSTDGDAKKQALYQDCRERELSLYPSSIALSVLGSPSLLDRVQERAQVDGNVRQLRRQRMREHGNVVYIPPQAKPSSQSTNDTRFPLMERLEEFISSDQMVFLLLGDSGAGKSTFNRQLENHLWKSYKKGGAIPLHINLPAIDKPEHDMIAKQLRKVEFTEPQIRELKQHHRFILICDGYDESQQTHNLYTSNRLNKSGEWKAKMVISCRSEYIGVDYRARFQPEDRNQRSEAALLQEAVIAPFTQDQVISYIDQYVSVHRPLWGADEYKTALNLIPSLKDLVTNPFLMSLSLEVLPRMVDPGQDFSATHITRVELYDQFIEHWLERGKKRLGERTLSPQARAAFESLSDEGFTQNGINFLKRLCKAVYKEQGGQPVIRYSRYNDEGSWKDAFFSRDEERYLLREACPLIRNGNQYRFIHRSLLEYGVALSIFDPQLWKEQAAPEPPIVRRGSTSSVSSSTDHDSEEAPSSNEQELDVNSPLMWRSFVSDPSVLQFLEERVQQEPLFKQQLFRYIHHSKTDRKWSTAAANAITVLVRAGVQFNGTDLRGIRIPGADLSAGVFDSAQLQGANLNGTDLRGVWMRQADLSGASMKDTRFGEQPFLKHDSPVTGLVYSPDGKSMAVGLHNGHICLYSTSTWDILWTARAHGKWIPNISFSSDGRQIASSSFDSTVCLWNVETGACTHIFIAQEAQYVTHSPCGPLIAFTVNHTIVKVIDVNSGECRHTLTGHTSNIMSVVFSPRGTSIASGSDAGTVQLWDTETGKRLHELLGHISRVYNVIYSPQGNQVASASSDNSVGLWDVATGKCNHILEGHSGSIFSIIYSSRGDRIVSGSWDGSNRVWDTENGRCLHVLSGHTSMITDIAYSPQEDLLVSSSRDQTVRLWDPETGVCRQVFAGHSGEARCVLFTPKGNQVISGSDDGTIRLWDIATETSSHVSSGHSAHVNDMIISPSKDTIVTSCSDATVRLWSVDTGECLQIFQGHTSKITTIAYSPRGDQIATGSEDCTVRLWDLNTGQCVHTLMGHSGRINMVTYSSQGNTILSGCSDNTVQQWDVNSGSCRLILIGHEYGVNRVMYLLNDREIASSASLWPVRIWSVDTGECIRTLSSRKHGILHMVLNSPDGNQIATSYINGTAILWDVSTGECSHVLEGHKSWINTMKYLPRGNQLVTGGRDKTLRLWDTETGKCLFILEDHTEVVVDASFSPQGDLLASASGDRTVRLWDIPSGKSRGVIQGLPSFAMNVTWGVIQGEYHLVTAYTDGSVQVWKLIDDGDQYRALLHWSTTSNALIAVDTNIQDVHGLSPMNVRLLKQRGALGEPIHRVREAGEKMVSMASVVSRLKSSVKAKPTVIQPKQEINCAKEDIGDILYSGSLC